jgi:hypothetical protein
MDGELLDPDPACRSGRKPAQQAGAIDGLAGLEPATSWVRFKSAATSNQHHERVSGQSSGSKPLGYPALTRGFGDGPQSIPKTEGVLQGP